MSEKLYDTASGGYFVPDSEEQQDVEPNGERTSQPSVEKIEQPFCVDWVDSTYQVVDDKGTLQESGTVLLVCNNIIYLKPLTVEQLKEMKRIVGEAVDYEVFKRNK